ncbi:MAG: S9 family peptidase [Flavobacteriaceae bacterium]|nr:S9 family peptidase [Flavobacteriaceae bacterium]
MKNIFKLLFLFASAQLIVAQQFTLNDLFRFEYFPQRVEGVVSMQDGEHYTLLTDSGIDKFSYKTFTKTSTIKTGEYSDYFFNSDESWLVLETERESIYRRSKLAVYHLYNMKTGSESVIFEGKKIQEPTLSPDGKKVAFVFENNLFVQEISSGNVTQITTDGMTGKIINGVTDWVYEEEFGFVRAFDWSADSKTIAFIRFDESDVPKMAIDIYGKDLYPYELEFKYPKAGEKNSLVELKMYDLASKTTQKVDLSEYSDFYIPKITFTKKADELALIVSNRHQNKLDIYSVNTQSLKKKKLFTETDKAWIETDNLTLDFLEDNSFLWSSERDAFRHIYHYTADGKLKNQVTKGNWEVTKFYGFNPKNNQIYYQSTEPGSMNRGVYSVHINGKKKQDLAVKPGMNHARFSDSFAYFILDFEKANSEIRTTLHDGKTGKQLSVLEDNARVKAFFESRKPSPKEFSEIAVNGVDLNSYMIKPKNFDPDKKYPLFMYLYGGPGSQEVLNNSGGFYYWWFQVLADQGYVIAVVDNRGTGGKGTEFKKVTYKNLGHYETLDQIAAAQYFGSLPYIDASRIGIMGWSYGGYMSSLALTKGADTFKLGIAVAPVTNWRFYDTVYTERFLQTPQENPAGYDQNSPINFAHLMKGKFLMIHGTADDNVHVQNAMLFAEALVQNNVDFEYMVYPDKNHGIFGGQTRRHLFTKMTNFILENL